MFVGVDIAIFPIPAFVCVSELLGSGSLVLSCVIYYLANVLLVCGVVVCGLSYVGLHVL